MADTNLLKDLLAIGDHRLPLCDHYAYLLSFADKVTHNREKSRELCGLYTYSQWDDFLRQNGITI